MVIFRADGNSTIGAGHIMRCLSIAETFNEIGEECVFVMSSDDFTKLVVRRGHKAIILKNDYRNMQPGDISPFVRKYKPAGIIVDSYFVTRSYLQTVQDCAIRTNSKLIYVDDRMSFPYSCDILLNYNVFGNYQKYVDLYEKEPMPRFLIGTTYTPLRMEFRNLPDKQICREAYDVLVSTGGADSEHLTQDLIKYAGESRLNYYFVVGYANEDKEKIYNLAENYENIHIRENVENMSEIMRSCDMAISAAGSTLYELCAVGIPTITYILADNQIPAAESFEANGIMLNCGDIRTTGKKMLARRLVEKIEGLALDYEKRLAMSGQMRRIVDGRGCYRIVENIV